jgi:hypothetical protein
MQYNANIEDSALVETILAYNSLLLANFGTATVKFLLKLFLATTKNNKTKYFLASAATTSTYAVLTS